MWKKEKMKVVISKSGPHVFFQKSRNISGTKRDMKKMKIGFRRVDWGGFSENFFGQQVLTKSVEFSAETQKHM